MTSKIVAIASVLNGASFVLNWIVWAYPLLPWPELITAIIWRHICQISKSVWFFLFSIQRREEERKKKYVKIRFWFTCICLIFFIILDTKNKCLTFRYIQVLCFSIFCAICLEDQEFGIFFFFRQTSEIFLRTKIKKRNTQMRVYSKIKKFHFDRTIVKRKIWSKPKEGKFHLYLLFFHFRSILTAFTWPTDISSDLKLGNFSFLLWSLHYENPDRYWFAFCLFLCQLM